MIIWILWIGAGAFFATFLRLGLIKLFKLFPTVILCFHIVVCFWS